MLNPYEFVSQETVFTATHSGREPCDTCKPYGAPGYMVNADQWVHCPTCNPTPGKPKTVPFMDDLPIYTSRPRFTVEDLIFDVRQDNVDDFFAEACGFLDADVESYEYDPARIVGGQIELKVFLYLKIPCPGCGREDSGYWEFPCPSDDCSLHEKIEEPTDA